MEEDEDDIYAPEEANAVKDEPDNAEDSEAMDEDEEEEEDSV